MEPKKEIAPETDATKLPVDGNGSSGLEIKDLMKVIETQGKQLEGVENLLGKFKQEQGEFRQEQADWRNQQSSTTTDDDYGEYITSNKMDEALKKNTEQIIAQVVGAFGATQQQSSLIQEYGLSEEQLVDVQEYAQKSGIGDLEAAYLKMNKDSLNPKIALTKKLINEKKNKGDFILEAGDSKDSFDIPSKLYKEGRFEEFDAWAEANPQSYNEWMRRKEKGK